MQRKPPQTHVRRATRLPVTRWASLGLPNVHRFILENTRSVKISYFGASTHIALGVALLLAAARGALLIAAVGTLRITQLRRHNKRQRRP